ncbi:MAG TPA: hypothetical protein VFE98_05180 [Candidatus Bathyarchaeia archaeon]|nr:hypothetical protein [Candidatus Bathyarchaeia archaeon]
MQQKKMSPSQGRLLFFAGIAILAVDLALSLYSVPYAADPRLPSFPFLELGFPVASLLLFMSAILSGGGWTAWRTSLAPFLALSAGLIVLGIFLLSLSLTYAVPIVAGGATLYVTPYTTQATEVVAAGFLWGLFVLIFRWRNKSRPAGISSSPSTTSP